MTDTVPEVEIVRRGEEVLSGVIGAGPENGRSGNARGTDGLPAGSGGEENLTEGIVKLVEEMQTVNGTDRAPVVGTETGTGVGLELILGAAAAAEAARVKLGQKIPSLHLQV